MRSQLWLLAASGHFASADWAFGQELDFRGGVAAHMVPRATGASTHDAANGWTPRPTEGPSIELVRRRGEWIKVKRQSDNTWVDETTCGWRGNTESEAFTCEESHSCATNTDQVVGCTSSGGPNPFFTVCLDYQAVEAGACESVGPKTGCCMTKSIGECITYLWPGSTVKSMFRCYTERAVITMLSTPFVKTTSTTSRSTSSASKSATSSVGGGSPPAQSTTGISTPPPISEGGTNVGAIVGGVVGGVAGLALIAGAVAFFVIRSRKKKADVGAGTSYSAVAPGDPSYPGGPMPTGYPPSSVSPQMSQAGYFSPGSVGTTLQPETPYQGGNVPPVPGMYDPRHSYYDPAKLAEQQQQQGGHITPHSGYAPYPGAPTPPGGYPGPYHAPVSELDNTNVPVGHQNNPVEMAANPTQR